MYLKVSMDSDSWRKFLFALLTQLRIYEKSYLTVEKNTKHPNCWDLVLYNQVIDRKSD